MDRLFEKTEWRGECLVWTGATDAKGYGRIGVNNRSRLAHRVAWSEQRGESRAPLLMHTCDNPPCVWLEHLVEGSIADNTADMYAKGRERPAWRGVTHCRRKHEFTPENTYITPDGRRNCRRCRRRDY